MIRLDTIFGAGKVRLPHVEAIDTRGPVEIRGHLYRDANGRLQWIGVRARDGVVDAVLLTERNWG